MVQITVEITFYKQTLIGCELIWYLWSPELSVHHMQFDLAVTNNY